MKTLDIIGLDAQKSSKTVQELQQLLADLHVFYMNARGFHWNIKGDQFFTLHDEFETIYSGLEEKIDEVAERILTLGGVPVNQFSKYLQVSKVKEVGEVNCPIEAVEGVLNIYKVVIAQERAVANAAEGADDEVTADLMTEYLTEHEKKVWMLVSYLQKA